MGGVVVLVFALGLAACGATRRREVGEPVTIIVVPAGHPVPVYQGVWPTVLRTPDAGLSVGYVGVDGGLFADVSDPPAVM